MTEWEADKVAVLVDEHTQTHCLPKIKIDDPLIIQIKSGEINKNLSTCEHIWSKLTQAAFTRKSLMINLGGGVIGDMGGFVAGTYKRGIRFINIPTTLLSQVDASIGGKLGIDFTGLKNHIGLFKNPDHVVVNTDFLSTLSIREIKSGFAEVIKHALIADESHWHSLLDQPFDSLDWQSIIPKSIAIKNEVVLKDPTEKGYRKTLNFGHTLGHALESYLLETKDRLLHGEAVAVGMVLESHLSYQKEWLKQTELEAVTNYILKTYELAVELPDVEVLYPLLLQDKKNTAKGVSFSLLRAIGNCDYDINVTHEMIKESLQYFNRLK